MLQCLLVLTFVVVVDEHCGMFRRVDSAKLLFDDQSSHYRPPGTQRTRKCESPAWRVIPLLVDRVAKEPSSCSVMMSGDGVAMLLHIVHTANLV